MKRRIPILLLLAGCAQGACGQSNGIFADFSTTLGNFTVALDYANAPRAVANFVGLATSEGSWADPQGNVWQSRFYDGSLFHRVAYDTNGFGVAIQGGGFETRAATTVDRPVGVSTSIYAAQLTVTNSPGIVTNVLNLPVVTTNAAAISTNYVLNGTTVATNAPMITLSWIEATVTSSNPPMGTFTSRAAATAGFTNFTLAPQVTTSVCPVAIAVTNGSGTNVATFHSIAVQAVASNLLRAPTVRTNFVDAGYDMPESVTNGLAHSNGVISMANAGPNTDGSQFFITVTNVPAWDGSYSVFGHVVTGMSAVRAIAAAPVGAGDRPVQDVVLSNVVIRRVGAAALNFNIASQGVPIVESGALSATTAGSDLVLRIEKPGHSETFFRESKDLQAWEGADWGLYTGLTTVVTGSVPRSALGDTYFFHASQIFYPIPITAPASQRNRHFTFFWDTLPAVTYEVVFNANWQIQGQYWVTVGTNPPVTGAVFIFDTWTQAPYSAQLYFADNSGQEFNYSLGFNSGQTTNRFTGTRWVGAGVRSPISGTFTVQ